VKIAIKNRWTAEIIFECEADSLRVAVELAVSKRVSLRAADLSAANLSDANLRAADLSDANLRDVNLRAANLSDANLRDAKEDYFEVLSSALLEVPGVFRALLEGHVDGSTYHGKCACLVGTIANVRKVDVDTLDQNSTRPAERFFMAIRKGDTPENNPASALAAEWTREFAKAKDIHLPERRVVWE
jgi:Pentapeptide repeats (8 copies)